MKLLRKIEPAFLRKINVLILILLFIHGCYQLDEVDRDNPTPHTETSEGTPLDEETINEIQAVLDYSTDNPFLRGVSVDTDNLLMPSIPGVVVGIAIPGKQTWFGASGFSDLERMIPMTVDDKFRAGSITKTFVATAMVRLSGEVEELSLDDMVEEWLPGVIPNGEEVTIRNLLMHSSCLNNYTNLEGFTEGIQENPARRWTRDEFITMTNDAGPVCDNIGENFNYSNTNYFLLGLILEKVKGEPLNDILEEYFFQPLQLENTYFQTAGDAFPGDYATGYFDIDDNFVLDVVPYVDPSALWAAGAVFSDVKDLLTWVNAIFLTEATVLNDTLHSQRLNTIYTGIVNEGSDQTLESADMGIGMGMIRRGEMLGHVGEIYGYSVYGGVYVEKQIGIVVLTNRTRYNKESNKEMDVFTIIDQIFLTLYPDDYEVAEVGKYEGYDEESQE